MHSVLVADHEPAVAEMARRYLERASMPVLVTTSPAETVRALAGKAADVFVIDLTMPGLQVRAVRQALTAGIPVVFLLDRSDPRPHGLNSPPAARRWLVRPFSPRALVVAVAELLHPVPGKNRLPGHADRRPARDRRRRPRHQPDPDRIHPGGHHRRAARPGAEQAAPARGSRRRARQAAERARGGRLHRPAAGEAGDRRHPHDPRRQATFWTSRDRRHSGTGAAAGATRRYGLCIAEANFRGADRAASGEG